MIPEFEGPTSAGSANDSGDDTIELDLTGEQALALSRAAEAARAMARPDEPAPRLFVPMHENFSSARTARVDFVCNVTLAVAALAIAVVSLWPASNPHRPAPALTSTARLAAVTLAGPAAVTLAGPAAVTLAGPAEPRGAPVRIKNAFDATEVFEFPHGTTESEAREAVAELLLSRARDRRAEGPTFRRAVNLQPDRGAAAQQPEVLVTKSTLR